MDTGVIGLAAVITEAIASCTATEELPFMAALLTAVGDQLALIAVCRANTDQGPGSPGP